MCPKELKKTLFIEEGVSSKELSDIFADAGYETVSEVKDAETIVMEGDVYEGGNKLVSIGDVKSITNFIVGGGVAALSKDLIEMDSARGIITDYFKSQMTIKMEMSSSSVKSYKISSFKGAGCYSDIVALEIAKIHEKVDYNNLRVVIFNLLNTMFNLKDIGSIQFPIDLDISLDGRVGVVRLLSSINDKYRDDIVGELLQSFENMPVKNCVDLVEVKTSKRSMLALTLYWFGNTQRMSTSFLIGRKFKITGLKWNKELSSSEVCSARLHSTIADFCKSKNVNESFYKLHTLKRSWMIENPSRFIRLISSLEELMSNEDPPMLEEFLTEEELSYLLSACPLTNIVDGLTAKDRELLLKILQDKSTRVLFEDQYEEEFNRLISASTAIEKQDVVDAIKATSYEEAVNWVRVTGKVPAENSDEWKVRRLEFASLVDGTEDVTKESIQAICSGVFDDEELVSLISEKIINSSFDRVIGSSFNEIISDIINVHGGSLLEINLNNKILRRDSVIRKMKDVLNKFNGKIYANSLIQNVGEDITTLQKEYSEIVQELFAMKIEFRDYKATISNDLKSYQEKIDYLEEMLGESGVFKSETENNNSEKRLEEAKKQIEELQSKLGKRQELIEKNDLDIRVNDNSNSSVQVDDKRIQQLEQKLKNYKEELDIERARSKSIQSRMHAMTTNRESEIEKEVAIGIKRTESKYEHKMKQMQMISDKMANSNNKAQQDLIGKKQEVVKLKAENTASKNQIITLERKLRIKAA